GEGGDPGSAGEGGVPGTGGGPGTGGDGGTGGSGGGCAPGALCDGEYNYAFVTSQAYKGDLGGLEGADSICNELAADAGLPGTYVAWLSISTTDARSRLGDASGWIRPDRRPIAKSREALFMNPHPFLFPLALDEKGEPNTAY